MRPQRRHFVVEVKRGTSRAAFVSTDGAADKFTSAEDALFGPRVVPHAVPTVAGKPAQAMPAHGRILRDLQEPPPPPPAVAEPPARRGRKPGSKNKPKAVVAVPPEPASTVVRPAWIELLERQEAEAAQVPPAPILPEREVAASRSSAEREAAPARVRFRERSTILKRYVLGTEPAPGQTGWRRDRRAQRQG